MYYAFEYFWRALGYGRKKSGDFKMRRNCLLVRHELSSVQIKAQKDKKE
jgi:hypothetical protein